MELKFKNLFVVVLFIFSTTLISAQWIQLGQDINGNNANDGLGWSVSLSDNGNILALSSPFEASKGSVKVFENIDGAWIQKGDHIYGPFGDISFGGKLSTNGDGQIVAVSSRGSNGQGIIGGKVGVYQIVSGTWELMGHYIQDDITDNLFGWSMSMSEDGHSLVVSAPGYSFSGIRTGYVKVYSYQNESWQQNGQTLLGEADDDRFGEAVSMNDGGDIVAISAVNNSGNGQERGKVKIFRNISGEWVQQGQDLVGEGNYEQLGFSVSLNSDGNFVAIGAPHKYNFESGANSGQVSVFQYFSDISSWEQYGTSINGGAPFDWLGYVVSLSADGQTVAISSATYDISEDEKEVGNVKVYRFSDSDWTLKGNIIIGTSADNWYGQSLSMSSDGNTVAIGAPRNDANGTDAGQVQVFQFGSTAVTERYNQQEIWIYPNPSQGFVNIMYPNQFLNSEISILTLTGKTVFAAQLRKSETTLNLSKLANGIYFLKIQNAIGVQVQRVVLNR